MQRRKSLKNVQRVLVFLVALCVAFVSSSPDAMAKSKKVTQVKKLSLRIGNEEVTKKTYKMKLGEKKKIKVGVSPKKGRNTIQFSTSNKKVAVVSKKGVVTARKIGTASIKVSVRKGTTKKRKVSPKKTTWVKIRVAKVLNQKDITYLNTTSPTDTTVTPKPEQMVRPSPEPSSKPDEAIPSIEPGDSRQGKSLIVYFSCTDTTKKIAEYVQESTGADIYRIEPEVPYTAEDLNYGDASTRATKEQSDSSARPAIAGRVENMAQYQTVMIAYPIWWGQSPRIISTFLESYDFSNKTIVPVCTSHSSGMGSSATNLHVLTDPSATWLEGRRFSSTTTKEEVEQWLKDSTIYEQMLQNREESMKRIFNFETKMVTLNSGYQIPLNGIGTYSLTGDTCVTSVSEALKRGVRLIETAYMYHNEAEVGRAVRESGIPRDEIFVTTKLYPNQFVDAENAIDEALEKLDIEYIDARVIIGLS